MRIIAVEAGGVPVHGGGGDLHAAGQPEGGAEGHDQDVEVGGEQIDQDGDARRTLQI